MFWPHILRSCADWVKTQGKEVTYVQYTILLIAKLLNKLLISQVSRLQGKFCISKSSC